MRAEPQGSGSGPDLERGVLLGLLALLAVLSAYRGYNYWTTGFFVSDEFGYFFNALHGLVYSDRWFFGWVNILVFRLLGVSSVDQFALLLPFYIFFWTASTLVVVYKLLKLLGYDSRTTSLTLISSFSLISFVLLSLGFLTEPVGLCMAMLGIYFMVRYMKSTTPAGTVAASLLAICSFFFASGTREPYNALLIGGMALILVSAFSKRSAQLQTRRIAHRAFFGLSILVIVATGLLFLFLQREALAEQAAPITTNFLKVLFSTDRLIPSFRPGILLNTALIFVGGLFLGWGPVGFAVGTIGIVLLVSQVDRERATVPALVLLAVLFSLGSYLVVSFLFAPDPHYFSLRNYSTIIRFSDTALPAYFLAAPAILVSIGKSKKRILGLAAVTLVVLVALVPVYQIYAASNLSYTGSNPFVLGYRSPSATVRDYVSSHPQASPFNIVGVPYGWVFTPGVQDLHNVTVFDTNGADGLVPTISYTSFLQYRWSTFYIFTGTSNSSLAQQPYYIRQLILNMANSSSAFHQTSEQIVVHGSGFELIRSQIAWNSATPA